MSPPRAWLGAGYSIAHQQGALGPATLAGVLVLFLAADVGLIGLYGARERLVGTFQEALADALHQEPGRGLADADLAIELHARRALDASGHHVERDGPLLETELAGLHDPVPFRTEK